jgi:hypothetical protein
MQKLLPILEIHRIAGGDFRLRWGAEWGKAPQRNDAILQHTPLCNRLMDQLPDWYRSWIVAPRGVACRDSWPVPAKEHPISCSAD